MNTDHETTADPRAEYIAGLRELADLLELHPELTLPLYGKSVWIPMSVSITRSEDQKRHLARWARLLPGEKTKHADTDYFTLNGALRGLHIKVVADRDEVCDRVVVGTREVTEDVPDPELLAAVPVVSVTRTVEDVEWICNSILDVRPVELMGAAA